MTKDLNLESYYAKLARRESITEDEIVDLLEMAAHFQAATAYLASCQAATLESLPSRASKSERDRHRSICEIAAKLLSGDDSSVRYRTKPNDALDRCLRLIRRELDPSAETDSAAAVRSAPRRP